MLVCASKFYPQVRNLWIDTNETDNVKLKAKFGRLLGIEEKKHIHRTDNGMFLETKIYSRDQILEILDCSVWKLQKLFREHKIQACSQNDKKKFYSGKDLKFLDNSK